MKTIFIVVTRGFIVRNILRSGVLKGLKEVGYKIVILFPERGPIPQYLLDEFVADAVTVLSVKEKYPKGYSFFARITSLLTYSGSTWMYAKVGNKQKMERGFIWKYLEAVFYYPLSKISTLKRFVRFLELKLFKAHFVQSIFDTYTPDLVFSTSIVSTFDIFFMQEASRRGIKTVSMPKGWDNISKLLYRFIPDAFLVQNERMRDDLVRYQDFPSKRINVVGFPQFDWYRNNTILQTRAEFMESIGFLESDRLIFFGSEGIWVPEDHKIAASLVDSIDSGEFEESVKLLVRPHFSDVKNRRFDFLKGHNNVSVDSTFTFSDFFMDNWDPSLDEIKYFTNLIYHCDVLVTTASTLTLDAAAYDKPIINLMYGGLFDAHTGKDITHTLYNTNHSKWIVETDGATFVQNREELINAIKKNLNDPGYKAESRLEMLRRLCYRVDGKVSERIVDVICQQLA